MAKRRQLTPAPCQAAYPIGNLPTGSPHVSPDTTIRTRHEPHWPRINYLMSSTLQREVRHPKSLPRTRPLVVSQNGRGIGHQPSTVLRMRSSTNLKLHRRQTNEQLRPT